jgi:hypothetical protein
MELLVGSRYRSLSRAKASGFAERLQGFGGVHASGLQQVYGGGPDLSDERAGLQIVALLEYGRCLPCGPERELAGIMERVIWLLKVPNKGLYRQGELQDSLGELPGGGSSLAHHRHGGTGQHASVTHGEIELVGRGGVVA